MPEKEYHQVAINPDYPALIKDMREEHSQLQLATALLMREVMLAQIRRQNDGSSLARTGLLVVSMPRVGIKALIRYVDVGLLAVSIETLQIYADRVIELLELESEQPEPEVEPEPLTEEQREQLRAGWLKLTSSESVDDRQRAQQAFRDRGFHPGSYMILTAEERAEKLAGMGVPLPGSSL